MNDQFVIFVEHFGQRRYVKWEGPYDNVVFKPDKHDGTYLDESVALEDVKQFYDFKRFDAVGIEKVG